MSKLYIKRFGSMSWVNVSTGPKRENLRQKSYWGRKTPPYTFWWSQWVGISDSPLSPKPYVRFQFWQRILTQGDELHQKHTKYQNSKFFAEGPSSSVETTSSGTKYRKNFFLKRSRDSDNGFVISVLENSESRHNLKTRFRYRSLILPRSGRDHDQRL